MNLQDLITFFHPRGEASVFAGEWGTHRQILALSKTDIGRVQLTHDGSPDGFYPQLKNAMKSGGLVVVVAPDDRTLQVLPVSAGAYEVPQKMLGLDVDGGTKVFELETTIRFDLGDHFLIPADRGSETLLEQLRQMLKCLPADQERNIFNVLRRPSVELRVQTLEKAIQRLKPADVEARLQTVEIAVQKLKPAEKLLPKRAANGKSEACTTLDKSVSDQSDEEPKGGLARRMWSFCSKHWLATAIVVLMLLAVSLAWKYSESLGLGAPPPAVLNARRLLAAMAASTNTAVGSLYKSHGLATLKDSSKNPFKDDNFASAVVKLELLRASKLPSNSPDLSDRHTFTDSSKVLDTKAPGIGALDRGASAIGNEPETGMLRYICCQSFSRSKPNWCSRVSGSTSCDDSSPDTVGEGLEELISFASRTAPPPTAAVTPPPFVAEARGLLKTMAENGNKNVKWLFSHHQLADMADPSKNPIKEPNFAYAVVKLELMRTKLLTGTSSDLDAPKSVADSVSILKQHVADVKQGKSVMLGYVTCQAFGFPGLRTTMEDVKIPGEEECTDNLDDKKMKRIEDGFAKITEFVTSVK